MKRMSPHASSALPVVFLLLGVAGCGEDSPSRGTPAACAAEVGTCTQTQDSCGCGTTCMRLGADRYECRISCEQDAQCTEVSDPATGAAFTRCVDAQDLTREPFGRYCE